MLDTHTFLWAVRGDSRLPAEVRQLLAADTNRLLVSVASLWEIVAKASSGRLVVWKDPRSVHELEQWVQRMGAEVLPIQAQHAIGIWRLGGWPHKDPFDRMLAVQAMTERATLVTADTVVQQCPDLSWIWDSGMNRPSH